jgi:hypothetical protein
MDSGGEQAGGIELSTKRQALLDSLLTKFDFMLTIGERRLAIVIIPLLPGVLVCQAPSIEFQSDNKTKEKSKC